MPDVQREFVVHRDAESLAEGAAARLVALLVQASASGATSHVCLTGGGPGTAMLAQVAASDAVDGIPWNQVHLWWSDERFLPDGDPERNETQARAVLLDRAEAAGAHVHAIPALGDAAQDPDRAADAYAGELDSHADGGRAPEFDVLLLGMGEEGHVASIFPESPAAVDERPVVAVRHSPKPPPTRVSFTFPTIRCAREVWVVTAGPSKADAIRLMAAGAGPRQLPVAGAVGSRRTLFLLDVAAAAGLPPDAVATAH